MKKILKVKCLSIVLSVSILLCSTVCFAQYDSTRALTPVNADGFNWKTGKFRGALIIPLDTFKLKCADSGALAYVNRVLYQFTCPYWQAIAGGSGGGTGDTIRLTASQGLAISGVFPNKNIRLQNNVLPGPGITFTQIDDTTFSINSTGASGTYLDEAPPPVLEDSTLTFIPDIKFYEDGIKDSIQTSTGFVIHSVPTGYKQYISFYIKLADNTIDSVQGNVDTSIVSLPQLPPGSIMLTYVYVENNTRTVGETSPIIPVLHWGGDTTLTPIFGSKNNVGVSVMTANQIRAEFTNTGDFVMKEKLLSGLSDSYQSWWFARSPTSTPTQQFLKIGMIGYYPYGAAAFSTNGFFDFGSSIGYYQYENNPIFNCIGTVKIRGTGIMSFGNSIIGSETSAPTIARFYNTSSGNLERTKVMITNDGRIGMTDGDISSVDPSAALDIKHTTKGLLKPRMTTTQMNAISSPATGLEIYNTTVGAPYYYNGSSWVQVAAGVGGGGLDAVLGTDNQGLNKTLILRTNPPDLGAGVHEVELSPTNATTGGGGLTVRGSVPTVRADYGPSGIYNNGNQFRFPDGTTGNTAIFPVKFVVDGNDYYADFSSGIVDFGSIGSGGTVTSVATGYGLSGGTITGAGTLLIDSATLSAKYLRVVDTNIVLSLYKAAIQKNIDSLSAHNSRIGKNSDSLTAHNNRIGKNSDSLTAHNTRIGANTVALTKIISGSYQPTITSVANLDAVSISRCIYKRVSDSSATVSGEITFDPTASGGVLARARFTLPIASDLNAGWQCDGVVIVKGASTIAITGYMDADTTNDQAEMNFPSNFTTSVTAKFELTYYIR